MDLRPLGCVNVIIITITILVDSLGLLEICTKGSHPKVYTPPTHSSLILLSRCWSSPPSSVKQVTQQLLP